MTKLIINTNEHFEPLPHAPIVEAVIDIRARAGIELKEDAVKKLLAAKLGDYQCLGSMQHIQIQHEMDLKNGAPIGPVIRELGWKGLRFQSGDKKHIVQFNRAGFVFSRLEPYESWEQLLRESMRLWAVYIELIQPVELHRIGLRYINRIQLPPDEPRFGDYLLPAPKPPLELDVPFHAFLHQDTLAVPGHPYAMNVIRTIQPSETEDVQGTGLILDIDVFTTQGFDPDEALFERRLPEMRWLKNKVFFGSITENALRLFR